MKTRALPPIAFALMAVLTPPAARAGHHNRGVSINDRRSPVRCEDVSIHFDDQEAVRSEERLVYPVEAGRPLKVEVPTHSGANVRGTDRNDFEVLLCKAAETPEG